MTKSELIERITAKNPHLTLKDVERVVEDIEVEENEILREYYRVIFDIVIGKNPKYLGIIRRKAGMERIAADLFMEVYKDKIDERVNEKEKETIVTSIKNLMINLKFTVEQAMEALSIPQSQWDTYAGLVSKSKQ